MNAGELKDIITLKHRTVTTTATGAESISYTSYGDYRAKTVFGKMWRSVMNDEVYYSQSIYFTVRQYVEVVDTDIIEWKGDRYRIVSIEHKREEMVKEITTELMHE